MPVLGGSCNEFIMAKEQENVRSPYSRHASRVHIDVRRDMHRHWKGALTLAKCGGGKKQTLATELGGTHRIYRGTDWHVQGTSDLLI